MQGYLLPQGILELRTDICNDELDDLRTWTGVIFRSNTAKVTVHVCTGNQRARLSDVQAVSAGRAPEREAGKETHQTRGDHHRSRTWSKGRKTYQLLVAWVQKVRLCRGRQPLAVLALSGVAGSRQYQRVQPFTKSRVTV